MILAVEARIQTDYERLLAASAELGAPEHFVQFSKLFAEHQLWRSYTSLLDLAPVSLEGGIAVDIGCKYGHALPIFLAQGARTAIGVDVIDEYLAVARDVLGVIFPATSFVKSEQGYLPITSETASVVMINEVISHVNPMYLPNLFSEVARVLVPGGYVLISDGNNIANAECRRDLVDVYDAWENGPTGRKTGRDVVDDAFIELRRHLVHERHPTLAAEKVEYLARNTSGLFGDYFTTVVDRYVAGGEFIERPYRHGICPTNPRDGGTVMEFGYHPKHIEMMLAAYGIRAERADPLPDPPGAPRLNFRTPRSAAGSALRWANYQWRHFREPAPVRVEGWGFQIRGLKER
jgi:SAM-dependent methyltransferase